MEVKSIIWFRHGLRIHDNPALLEAIKSEGSSKVTFYPVFIFDGITAGTKLVGYNRMKFLIESLEDLNEQFKSFGGNGLHIFRGDPVEIFTKLSKELGINKICFEQDCEPIWNERDMRVAQMCKELDITLIEKISHTLWDPNSVINANGGYPPLTYQMFLHTVNVLGNPSRPVQMPCFSNVVFGTIPLHLHKQLGLMNSIPSPEDFSLFPSKSKKFLVWKGGEKRALEQLKIRLQVEQEAFLNGTYLPNQGNPKLTGDSTSMSAALRFGCLSVRKFFYDIHDLFAEVKQKTFSNTPGGHHITGQLIWREYFYTMSVRNPFYAQMENNPICLNINWSRPNDEDILKWKEGRTGFPIIDASMRQILSEGWIHHTLRNITATFLTRTGLWYSWEIGLQHFLKYLLDADWSVCSGNWLWVSSSAFERLLDSSKFSIIAIAYRLDPEGTYIRRYIRELRDIPNRYIHEPWKTPLEIQKRCRCVIGKDYPEPMIDLNRAMQINSSRMKEIRNSLIEVKQPHVRPSNEDEIRTFFWIADDIAVKC
ncbi:hypothetical protein PVAND_012077 [Polypedilum vanderplanki]|uniref:Cryptochrome-1 n=1 Tax=Polypedilum vanderplanki TaxID=319348 RepID=A0A9J6CLB5_POLVA|nr:hypothetical protein PVAND_012077 [Polypedilum vanderplanki]